MKSIPVALSSLLFVVFSASASLAQVQRTFVSGLGSDANPCTRTAPCRTFGQAISQTNTGGEVVVLDSAGYGPVTITKAVSLIAPPGVYAGISVFSGDGIDINAGASDTVILRGLTVNNQGSSGNGISCATAGTLHVEGCVVSGFTGFFSSGLAFGSAGTLEVKDSIFRGNFIGIQVASAGPALAAIDHVRLEGILGGIGSPTFGLFAFAPCSVTVRSSLATGSSIGFNASGQSNTAELNLESCVASNNSHGVEAGASGTTTVTIRLSNSTITDNNVGLQNDGGSGSFILSRGNNTVEQNATNTSGTIGSYTAK